MSVHILSSDHPDDKRLQVSRKRPYVGTRVHDVMSEKTVMFTATNATSKISYSSLWLVQKIVV